MQQAIPTIHVEGIQPSTRQRSFSISNLVKRTRRAYSVSSAYPTQRQPLIHLPPSSSDLTLPDLTPTQRRNSIAASQRKYEDLEQKMEAAPLFVLVSTYLNYFILIIFGHLRDILGKMFKHKKYAHLRATEGYAPLVSDFDSFYTRRMYMRIRDCWNRPMTGVPGRKIKILERESKDFNQTFSLTGRTIEATNFSSYNYLGFAQSEGYCADQVETCVN
ncbi:serine palmitoyltransferase component, partial [Rhizopus azygosporus]